MTSLNELAQAWALAHPKRAGGGRWALAGFHFQLHDSLRTFFQPIVDGGEPGWAAFDQLSDYAATTQDAVYVAQHKRTLRRSTYFDALREFLEIESFLEKQFPSERLKISYRIVSSQTGRGMDTASLPLLDDLVQWSAWHRIVAEGRFLGVEVRPDPKHELIKLLWPRVQRPIQFVDKCLGLVFDGLGAGFGNGKALVHRLAEAYEEEKSKGPDTDCPILAPVDLTPESHPRGPVLMGERPTPLHWRKGCFMPRPDYVEKVWGKLQSILRPEETHLAQKTPIIWIHGGSGVGKSGLLLAGLERILQEEDLDCAWVRGSPAEIRKVLEKAPRQRLICGIDDLYAPQGRNAADWDVLAGLLRDRGRGLVCIASAPTEYFHALRQNVLMNELFEHHEIHVAPLKDRELSDYADWYAARTGADPTRITAARGDKNFILAALRYRILSRDDITLDEFNSRLWERLRELTIEAPMAAALAGIRLGIRAPISLFAEAAARDALAKLGGEYLFLTHQEEQADGTFVRRVSTHRQLAEALYALRFPESGPNVRAEHLLELWRHGDLPFRQVLLEVVGKKDKPVEAGLAHSFLKQSGLYLAADGETAEDFELLMAWPVCAKNRELPQVDTREALLPLCQRIRAGAVIPELLGCACELCWEPFVMPGTPASEELAAAARTWLDSYPDAKCWNHIWQRLWDRNSAPGGRASLLELARTWLPAHRNYVGWNFVFQKLFDAGLRDQWLADEADGALPLLPPNGAEFYVMRKAADLIHDRRRLVEHWMARIVLQTNWHFHTEVLKELTKQGCRLTVECLEQVAGKFGDAVGAGHVLHELLKHFKSTRLSGEEYLCLSSATLAWLEGREDNPEWSHVWCWLVKVLPAGDARRSGVLNTGLTWLEGREDKPGWAHVWQGLVEVLPAGDARRSGVLDTGLARLEGREDKPEWAHVWQRLVKVLAAGDARRSGVLDTGLTWLEGREDKPEWSYVWEWLMNAEQQSGRGKRGALCAKGLLWLSRHSQHPRHRVVQAMLRQFCP